MNNNSHSYVVFDHDGTLINIKDGKILYEGIKELVEFLKNRGVKCYVWTARTRFSTIEILKSVDILDFFEQLHCSTDSMPKPSPIGLAQMLDGVDPKEVIVIGDSVTDIYGAKNYGALAIGAIWDEPSIINETILLEAGADHICKTVSELKKLLNDLI